MGWKAFAVAVLMCLVRGNAGARHLSQHTSSVSASVSGSPGTTGNIQMSFSGDGGSFQQSIPVQGPTAFQFSTDNGGTVSLINPSGPPQVFTSVLGPPGSVPPLPQAAPIALPKVQIPQVGAGTPFALPALDLSPLDPDFATKVRERIQALFDRLRASGSFVPIQPSPVISTAGGSPPNPQQVVQNIQQNAVNQLNQVTGQAVGDNAAVTRTGPTSVSAYSQSNGPNAKTALNLSAVSTG
ncbi:hypothetical protein BSKO_05526 [Bryopsis sp. KO-2023]|nr:hypothetical protein BSKO_05526 [Bryopsis sp. KO-2023]